MYYVNVNGKYYRFVDVPGNGNCFYYSVLRHQSLEQRFDKSDSASLRQYLSSVVSTCFRDDEVVQNLFEYEGVNYKNWCKSIETDGRWTSTFDRMIFSYVMKTNVITVGNYLNGFSIQSMKNYFHTINPHLEVSDQGFIPEHPQIHIFFHIHKSPLVGASSGNHFGYLQPLSSCTLNFDTNTIKEVGVRTTQKQPTLNEWCKTTQRQPALNDWCKTWDWINNERITIAKENVELENKKEWQEMFESKKEVIAGRREKDTPAVTPIRICKGRHEHTWAARGCIIYFFLHKDLGNKNMKDTCKVFGLNVSIHVILSTLTLTLDYLY